MPDWLSSELFPPGYELIAASHDVGKITPGFQERIRRTLPGYVRNTDVGLEYADPDLEQTYGYHGGATASALSRVGEMVALAAAQHHGSAPPTDIPDDAEVLGGLAWKARRDELLESLCRWFDAQYPRSLSESQAVAISGLTSVADWIGSRISCPADLADHNDHSHVNLAARLVDGSGFHRVALRRGLGFEEIFGFSPTPTQTTLGEVVKRGGTYVVEAPTGSGKTEAALFAAYRLLESGNATGLYFALPTQVTSNRIHRRVSSFLGSTQMGPADGHEALLLHGSARLRKFGMSSDGAPGGGWFLSAKRGLLAPFAVGTLDQALMGAMNVRHSFVRSFGLAGKVVILDEVHSYDAYTGCILDSLLSLLASLGCTTIVLSATLTSTRVSDITGRVGSRNADSPYPAITARSDGNDARVIPLKAPADTVVTVDTEQSAAAAIEEALARAEEGQQVLWIENTVGDAQSRFREISARAREIGALVGLIHSRFTRADREARESRWVDLLGRDSQTERLSDGRILVGTQVLEQSLDIDADFLVSAIAPTDMLVQRMGRLWRHQSLDSRRPPGARREFWILLPEDDSSGYDPAHQWGPSGRVYAPYVLHRTREVWDGIGQVAVPSQVKRLLEATYDSRDETGPAAKMQAEMRHAVAKLRSLARVGISKGAKTLDDASAGTRYSEIETREVLLLKDVRFGADSIEIVAIDLTVVHIPIDSSRLSPEDRREIALSLAQNVVTVPVSIAPRPPRVDAVSWLRPFMYVGSGPESLITVATVSNQAVVPLTEQSAGRFTGTYSSSLGYVAEKVQRIDKKGER